MMVMQQYNLQRRWFTYSQIPQLKAWFNECKDEDLGHFGSIVKVQSEQGKGLSASVGKAAGYSMADVLYNSLERPDYMIYVNRLADGRLWFAFAFDGVLTNDVVISDEYFASSKYQFELMKLMQEFERFENVNSHVVQIYSTNCSVVDDGLSFFELFQIPVEFEYQLEKFSFDPTSSIDELEDQANYQLHRISDIKYPKNWKVLGPVLGVVGLALLYMITPDIDVEEVFKEEEPEQIVILPPVVIDTFKDLKLLLTEDGVGIKQRFVYIINDIHRANQVPGWRVQTYIGKPETGIMTLTQTFGELEPLKQVFPESHYFIESTVEGVRIFRKIPTFPILNEAVRANINAEQIWLINAIEWVWKEKADIKVTAPKKDDARASYVEKEMTVKLQNVFNEDLDSLSSLFVGRSAEFSEFEFNYNEGSNSYAAEFKAKIIGVPDAYYRLEKR